MKTECCDYVSKDGHTCTLVRDKAIGEYPSKICLNCSEYPANIIKEYENG